MCGVLWQAPNRASARRLHHTGRQERMSRHAPTTSWAGSLSIAAIGLALVGLAGCSGIGTQSGTAPLPGDVPSSTAGASTSDAPTSDAAVRSAPVVPGRRARVFIFAGFGTKCEPVAAPQITITAPPAKGDVTFVPGQETTIQASAQGTCIGQKTQGTGVYYTARAGQKGTDRFSVSAKLASGETSTRTFEVRIED
jgi:hypothetical protein